MSMIDWERSKNSKIFSHNRWKTDQLRKMVWWFLAFTYWSTCMSAITPNGRRTNHISWEDGSRSLKANKISKAELAGPKMVSQFIRMQEIKFWKPQLWPPCAAPWRFMYKFALFDSRQRLQNFLRFVSIDSGNSWPHPTISQSFNLRPIPTSEPRLREVLPADQSKRPRRTSGNVDSELNYTLVPVQWKSCPKSHY